MSKIMEALQKPLRVNQQKTSPKVQKKQDQIADVYFKNAPTSPSLPEPTIIRVEDNRGPVVLPWVIALLCIGMAAFALWSTKRIAIDIRVIDLVPQVEVSEDAVPVAVPPTETENVIASPFLANEEISFQPPQRELSPLNFTFAGAAILNSSRDRQQLTLSNSTLSGLAYAANDFDTPLPGLHYSVSFEARGRIGGEQLELILKDANGNSSLNWKTLLLFPNGLTTEWESITLPLQSTDFFNADAIKQMRIEFGTQRTGNLHDAVIFIRNLRWVPNAVAQEEIVS